MTTPHEKALEAASRELGVALVHMIKTDVAAKHTVQAYLTSLSEQGWKMAPVEPAQDMLVSGGASIRDFYEQVGPYPRTKAMYKAMINAAPKVPE